MKLNKLLTGYQITDEVINRTSSAALPLEHSTIRYVAADFEIWTGAGKTGTKLTLTTDFVLAGEDEDYTTEAGVPIYTTLAIVNGAYQSIDLYGTYKTIGDYASVANVRQAAREPLQLRYNTAAVWTSENPILALSEPGAESDTGKLKIGDGITAWNSLNYCLAPLSSTPSAGKVATWSHGVNTSFTPTVEGIITAGACTYSTRGGVFNVIGNICFLRLYVYWSGHTGSGGIRIGGLGITANSDGAYQKLQVSSDSLVVTGVDIYGSVVNGQKYIDIGSNVSGGSPVAVALPAAGGIEITGFYVF